MCLILPTEIKCVSHVYIFLIKNINDIHDVFSSIFPRSSSFALWVDFISPQPSDAGNAGSFSIIVVAMAVILGADVNSDLRPFSFGYGILCGVRTGSSSGILRRHFCWQPAPARLPL